MVGACPRFWRWTGPCRLWQWNVCKSCFRIHDILDSCSSWRAPTWAYRFIASGLALEWIATRLIPNTSNDSNEFSNFVQTYISAPFSRHTLFHTNNSLRIPTARHADIDTSSVIFLGLLLLLKYQNTSVFHLQRWTVFLLYHEWRSAGCFCIQTPHTHISSVLGLHGVRS